MVRWALPLMIAALLLGAACSDDSNKNDTGPTPDTTKIDQAITDKGPQPDKGDVDQGPVTQKVETYVPADNEVPGWTEDPTKGFKACTTDADCKSPIKCDTTNGVCPGVDSGYTTKEIDDLIDGEHDPYATEGCTGFAGQHYKKDFNAGSCKGTLELKIWDMNTAAGAKKMYDADKLKAETGAGLTFETIPNVQTAGIIADDAPGWRVYAHKSTYIISMFAMYSDPACKADLKSCAMTWADTLTKKLP